MNLELKDLINIGLHFRNENLEKHNLNLFIKKTEDEIIIYDACKEWFYKFFNNLIYINNKDFDDKIDEINNKIGIEMDILNYNKKIILLCENLENIIKESKYEETPNPEEIKKLIEEKNGNNKIHTSLIKINLKKPKINIGYPGFLKNFTLFRKVIMMDNYENFKEYFENDDNFDIYFTYTNLFFCDFTSITNILDKLNFRNIEKIIYIDENMNEEKLEENVFAKILNLKNQIL